MKRIGLLVMALVMVAGASTANADAGAWIGLHIDAFRRDCRGDDFIPQEKPGSVSCFRTVSSQTAFYGKNNRIKGILSVFPTISFGGIIRHLKKKHGAPDESGRVPKTDCDMWAWSGPPKISLMVCDSKDHGMVSWGKVVD
jgi:hypothetical protein